VGYLGLLDIGFGAGLGKYIAKGIQQHETDDGEYLHRALGTGLSVLTCLGILIATIAICFRHPIVGFFDIAVEYQATAFNLLLIAGLTSLLLYPLQVASVALDAAMQIKINRILVMFQGLLCSFSMLGLAYFSVSPVYMMLANSAIILTLGSIRFLFVYRHIPGARFLYRDFSFACLKEIYTFSFYMFYWRLASMLSGRIDVVVVGKLVSVASVTAYTVCTIPMMFISTILGQLIGNIVLPTVYNLDARGEKPRIAQLLQKATKYRMMLVAPLIACGIVYIPTFLNLWMGEKYAQYAIWAQLYILCHIPTAFGYAASVGFGTNQQRLVCTFFTIRVALNVMVSIATVPYFGIGGPLVGTLTANVVLGDPILFYLVAHRMEIKVRKIYVTCAGIMSFGILFTALLYGFASLLPPTGWVSMLAEACVAAGLMYLFLGFLYLNREEKKDVRRVLEMALPFLR